ncbi:RNA methyltransferase [Tuwongella immobilis]|uniref:tRNA (cytidine/uridine-2'-O-)-methyltransferase TrmJ n=1 Tax=Tuwongella immobilis TaxID=692036 RepID=A0A6C2YJE6_9BACT|nr:RNA methyltransferase [Tuwongella immobilis]VIP01690.1 rna methyltransferase : Glr2140 protein OS=Gloeobacter violaceus (strain PCC 7421) GN=glr2140 PE=4 SV=1: SpoU_methylase [Tuwongella immobilis]VTR99158.1 rna methyltransferase : Glr2140 protein OS=Gloeobacter violaceus (strain PCC 7421) GN=glr2140 PE=4 SV=1: SpoU_methylase [Tuwongella immobilis]
MSLERVRIVLVETHYAGNLGATARVMRNFGVSDLVLVAPYARPNSSEALRMSTHGQQLLEQCRTVADLGEAIADCVCVAATSALDEGRFREQTVGPPDEVLPKLLAAMPSGPVAIVFGPEPSGLTNAQIARCHHLIRIRTSRDYSSLNLAQSVAICLYEMSRQERLMRDPNPPKSPIASHASQERMFAHLQDAFEAIHYLYDERRDALMHGIRQLIGRAGPTEQEVRMLHGLARQLLWTARNGVPQPDLPASPADPDSPADAPPSPPAQETAE